MLLFAEILFWTCWLALLHSYLFYPLLLQLLAQGKRPNALRYAPDDPGLPVVSVLMSLYNEEKVIAEKLASLSALHYPQEKLRFFIGSDCSGDGTDELVETWLRIGKAGQPEKGSQPSVISNFQFFNFPMRRGKPPVINDLARAALAQTPPGPGHLFLLTDASVMLAPDTLYCLARHFKNPRIGVVDARMRGVGLRDEGISRSEETYLSGEVQLKHHESLAWGCMIGPFGGCYALRSDLFAPIPPNFLVDDFYLTFRVLARGHLAINDLEAICQEGATHRVRDEFKRKKRIAAGSFQNLLVFWRQALPVNILGFAFFSHKVLRWFGGFLLLFGWLAAGLLAVDKAFYRWIFFQETLAFVGIPLLDWALGRLRRQVNPLKNATYFLAMNAALMAGFFQWLGGIKKNTWERTERY